MLNRSFYRLDKTHCQRNLAIRFYSAPNVVFNKQLLLKHIQKVHPQYTFTCKTCCYTTNENRQQKIHQYLNLCLYTPNKRVFECPKCHYLASYKIVNGHIQSVIFK